jgi:hypothetical protein
MQELRKRSLEGPRSRRKDVIKENPGEKIHRREKNGAGSKACLVSKCCVSGDEYPGTFITNPVITKIFMEKEV